MSVGDLGSEIRIPLTGDASGFVREIERGRRAVADAAREMSGFQRQSQAAMAPPSFNVAAATGEQVQRKWTSGLAEGVSGLIGPMAALSAATGLLTAYLQKRDQEDRDARARAEATTAEAQSFSNSPAVSSGALPAALVEAGTRIQGATGADRGAIMAALRGGMAPDAVQKAVEALQGMGVLDVSGALPMMPFISKNAPGLGLREQAVIASGMNAKDADAIEKLLGMGISADQLLPMLIGKGGTFASGRAEGMLASLVSAEKLQADTTTLSGPGGRKSTVPTRGDLQGLEGLDLLKAAGMLPEGGSMADAAARYDMLAKGAMENPQFLVAYAEMRRRGVEEFEQYQKAKEKAVRKVNKQIELEEFDNANWQIDTSRRMGSDPLYRYGPNFITRDAPVVSPYRGPVPVQVVNQTSPTLPVVSQPTGAGMNGDW